MCDVIVTDRSQFGHGLVNHRPRFLIMNERGEPGLARWRVELPTTFLVVMMDRISHGQITVIISHQPTEPSHQPANQNQIRRAGKTNCTTNRKCWFIGWSRWWEIWEIISNKCILSNLAQTIKAKDQESQSIFYVLTLSLAVSNLW